MANATKMDFLPQNCTNVTALNRLTNNTLTIQVCGDVDQTMSGSNVTSSELNLPMTTGERFFIFSTCLLIGFVATVVNVPVLVVWAAGNRLRHTPTSAVIGNLMIFDLSVAGALYLRAALLVSQTMAKSGFVCLFHFSCMIFGGVGTQMALLLAVVDRYVAIVYPLHYPQIVTYNVVCVCVAGTHLSMISFSFSAVIPAFNNWEQTKSCVFNRVLKTGYLYALLILIMLFMVTSLTLYVRVLFIARRHRKKIATTCCQAEHISGTAPKQNGVEWPVSAATPGYQQKGEHRAHNLPGDSTQPAEELKDAIVNRQLPDNCDVGRAPVLKTNASEFEFTTRDSDILQKWPVQPAYTRDHDNGYTARRAFLYRDVHNSPTDVFSVSDRSGHQDRQLFRSISGHILTSRNNSFEDINRSTNEQTEKSSPKLFNKATRDLDLGTPRPGSVLETVTGDQDQNSQANFDLIGNQEQALSGTRFQRCELAITDHNINKSELRINQLDTNISSKHNHLLRPISVSSVESLAILEKGVPSSLVSLRNHNSITPTWMESPSSKLSKRVIPKDLSAAEVISGVATFPLSQNEDAVHIYDDGIRHCQPQSQYIPDYNTKERWALQNQSTSIIDQQEDHRGGNANTSRQKLYNAQETSTSVTDERNTELTECPDTSAEISCTDQAHFTTGVCVQEANNVKGPGATRLSKAKAAICSALKNRGGPNNAVYVESAKTRTRRLRQSGLANIAFFCCWFPFVVIQLLMMSGSKMTLVPINLATFLIMMCSILNPFIYVWGNSRLRRFMRSWLRRRQGEAFIDSEMTCDTL